MKHLARRQKETYLCRKYYITIYWKLVIISGVSPGEERGLMNTIYDIPYGHKNPLARVSNPVKDRKFRKMVEDANNDGDCIINVGNGYYRPVPGDPVDEKELQEYLAKDLHRARAVLKKRLSMKMTFERWREIGILINHSRETG